MDPATLKMAAHIALSLAKSRAGRHLVAAVIIIWSVLMAAVLFLPSYFLAAGSNAMHRVYAAQSCTPTGPLAGVAAAAPGEGTLDSLSVASWNTLNRNSLSQVTAGVRSIGADVIGLQEVEARSRQGLRTALVGEYQMSAANNAAPVLWQPSRLELVTQGSVFVFGVHHVEGGVNGTSVGPKSITWVTLKQRDTGAVFTLINQHLVPTIDSGGHPDSRHPGRVGLARKQIAAAVQLADQLKAAGTPVLLTADWNVDLRKDAPSHHWLTTAMNGHGLFSNWAVLHTDGSTHDDRLIDAVWSNTATATFTGQQILGKYGSDHAAVLVRVTSRAAVTSSLVTTSLRTSTLPKQLRVPGRSAGSSMTLQGEQISNAAIIISEGKAHKIPEYGWVIAVATAIQESGIRNLTYGDRDSRGMFQQRPSSGWGTIQQVEDPHLSTLAFFGVASHTRNTGLVDIAAWQSMSVTDASQSVQRSAFGDAYAQWEAAARAIVQQLSGATAGAATAPLLCGTGQDAALGNCPPTGLAAEQGLTRDGLLILRCGKANFPALTSFGGVHPDPLPDHPSGHAVDFMIPHYQTAAGKALGWRVAHWMQAHHVELGVQYVIFDARIWSVERNAEGWRTYSPGYTTSLNDSSLHRNHVHVTVYGDQGTGFKPASHDDKSVAPGTWTMPLPGGSYRLGCSISCYPGHTGQDFPVHSGTKVFASSDGVVVRSVALMRRGAYVSYGNLVVFRVKGSPNVEVYNAHLQERLVTVGEVVKAGQVIGLSGYTGHVIPQGEGGAHLHYEIRVGGQPVDPMPVLRAERVNP